VDTNQAFELIVRLNRAGLLLAVEGQAEVWADALDDVEFDEAQVAVRALVKARSGAERWVTPGDVRAGVRDIRRARLAAAGPVLPDVDPDDVAAYQARRRELVAQVASGRISPTQIGA